MSYPCSDCMAGTMHGPEDCICSEETVVDTKESIKEIPKVKVQTKSRFKPCTICSKKSYEFTTLCDGCLHNRRTIEELQGIAPYKYTISLEMTEDEAHGIYLGLTNNACDRNKSFGEEIKWKVDSEARIRR